MFFPRVGIITIFFSVLLLICGCSSHNDAEHAKDSVKKSGFQTVIEGATGKTAIQSGQRAKSEIEAISAKRDADIDEVLSP